LTEFARLTSYIAPIEKPIMLKGPRDDLCMANPYLIGFKIGDTGIWAQPQKGWQPVLKHIQAW